MCLEKATGALRKVMHGTWTRQMIIFSRVSFAFLAAIFPLRSHTYDSELKLLIKITELKQKFKNKTNSILKKRGSSASAPGSNWHSPTSTWWAPKVAIV